MIQEGYAFVAIQPAAIASKTMDVFYNPIMKLNRDISILVLGAVDMREMAIGLPLAGSGIRGLRFLKELDKSKIKSVTFNDHSDQAVASIKKNLKLNNIRKCKTIKNFRESKTKIKIYNEDANLFLLNSKGFDYIDVDPFGTSNPFLDSAVKRISRDGILAVTNTDTAGLAGSNPSVCKRLYWAIPKKNAMMHETGLRILIRKIQLIGMQYDKALIPLFSYFKDHYFRIFFRCVKGKKECDTIVKEHGMFHDAGPLWLGKLFDSKLASQMYSVALDRYNEKETTKKSIKNKSGKKEGKSEKTKETKINVVDNSKELLKFLSIIKDESRIGSVGFYDTHGKGKKTIIRKEDLISKLKKKGFRASSTHFLGTGIRTNASLKDIKKIK